MSDYPSQQQEKFVLRLPDGLRDRIKRKAEENGRSMNAEIVQLLEETYPAASRVDRLLEQQQALFHRWQKETEPTLKAAIAEELIAVKNRVDQEIEDQIIDMAAQAKKL